MNVVKDEEILYILYINQISFFKGGDVTEFNNFILKM